MTDQPAESDVNRANLRAEMRRRKIGEREALPDEMRQTASTRIVEVLAAHLATRPPGVLSFCWPIRAEVDCRPLVDRLLASGWQAAMPAVVMMDAPMAFRRWWPGMPMAKDPYGIPIPATDEVLVPDIVLLPLVAFDDSGYRLGYGGGYFDRTLAACHPCPRTIGVGFAMCAVPTIHPAPHDMPLDAVVTENGLRSFNTA